MADVQLNTLGLVIKVAYEEQSNTNAFTDAEKTKLAGIEDGATASGGGDMESATYDPQAIEGDAFDTDNHTDGVANKVFTATEKTKLAGIEPAATADQTGAEIKALYETEADTNAYTDIDKGKVDALEAAAFATLPLSEEQGGTGQVTTSARRSALAGGSDTVGDLVQLQDVGGGTPGLPAVDGSQLTGITGGVGGFDDETPDSNTSITVGAADDSHKALTATSAITLALSQTAAVGVRQAFTPKTDQIITVNPASQARYLVPGDTDASLTTNVTDAVWGTPTGNNLTITSAGSNLPDYAAGDLFEVRNHSTAANNGLYIATGTPTAASLPCTKIDGTAPQAAASEAVDVDTLQRQANFTLTGYGEFEVIENTGGNAAVWRFVGESDLGQTVDGDLTVTGTLAAAGAATVGTTLGVTGAATVGGTLGVTGAADLAGGFDPGTGISAALDGNNNTISEYLVVQVADADGRTVSDADSGKTIIYSGAGHTFTFNDANLTAGAHGVIRNAGSGAITCTTDGTEKFHGTEPIPVDASATWEWDGTRLWLDVNE